MAFPIIGNLAPKFSLTNHEDKTVSLSDFKGESSVVVYFYPKAMTPGCTIQAQGLRGSALLSRARLRTHHATDKGAEISGNPRQPGE